MDGGQPRFAGGLTEQEAQALVQSWVDRAQEWLDAISERQRRANEERLTPEEQRAVKKLAKKFKLTEEDARAKMLAVRSDDYSDL